MTALVPVLGSTLGKIFQPIFQAMAWLIAFFYALIPNYAIAIALLTVVVMLVTAPLTVKSTKSMISMQRLSPEMKKLQQKYKGDRQKLNEEMMKLYQEHGVNPAGGCLPMFLQFPIFIVLYDVIRGLTNTAKVHGHVVAAPRYIGHGTRLYKDLLHSNGKMPSFGIDLAQRVLGHHTITAALPYAALILVAIGLQYLQMRQLNSRNPGMAQANPQAQMMQRYMPLIFAVIYINIPAGVNVYFIVSNLCRIGIQEAIFRSGVLDKPVKGKETRIGGAGGSAPRRKTFMERLADAQKQAVEAQQARQRALQAGDGGTGRDPGSAGNGNGSGRQAPGGAGGRGKGQGAGANGAQRSGPPPPGGSGSQKNQASNGGPDKQSHPRSKAKRTRKAR
jgi:YidC/Oxa1 family membrane protein insertase